MAKGEDVLSISLVCSLQLVGMTCFNLGWGPKVDYKANGPILAVVNKHIKKYHFNLEDFSFDVILMWD